MTSPLLCSVIVPTYNRSLLLSYTLDSLIGQTIGTEAFEVLVVDDGSSDDTAQVVAGYEDRLNIRYFFQEDEGYRVAKARNVGIAHASADVSVLVDSGVLLHAGALAAHVDSHRSSEQPVAVVGYVYCFNEDNEDGALMQAEIDPHDPTGTIDSLAAQKKWLDIREEWYEKYGDDFADLPAPWLVYWTCNVSARTAQLRSVGAFDEEYKAWGAEDVDLSYRLHRDGARFVLNRAASALHYPHPKSYEDHMAQAAGNYRYFAAKFGTPITALVDGNHFFVINDIIREKNLPACADYLAAAGRTVEKDLAGRSA